MHHSWETEDADADLVGEEDEGGLDYLSDKALTAPFSRWLCLLWSSQVFCHRSGLQRHHNRCHGPREGGLVRSSCRWTRRRCCSAARSVLRRGCRRCSHPVAWSFSSCRRTDVESGRIRGRCHQKTGQSSRYITVPTLADQGHPKRAT